MPMPAPMLTQQPFVVLWRVMDQCNLSCPFCAYDKRLTFARRLANPTEVARMIDLLAAWQDQSGRPVVLSWSGGEPTLWPALPEMSLRAADAGLRQSLTTNGTTLGSAAIRQLLAGRMAEVTISVDALGDMHGALRGWRGAFDKLAEWVPRLVADAGGGLRLRANVVLVRQTIAEFPALCEALADWGIRTITFNQLGGRDRPEFFPAHRLRREDIAHFAKQLPALRKFMPDVQILGGDAYVDRIVSSTADEMLPISGCRVAEDFLFIDEAGQVAPCAFVGNHFGVATGDLRSTGDLEDLTRRICTRQRAEPAAACHNCMSTQQFSKFAA
jgi:MoaA/NifB/PqqE/SkfB family radical SAM enzyme